MNDNASAIGPAKRTPLNPKISGKQIISGVKKSTCLVRDMKIPFCGFPIDVKKFDDSGCRKAVNIPKRNTLKYFSQNSKYSASPEPKIETICLGKSWKQAKLVNVMQAASLSPKNRASLTRL